MEGNYGIRVLLSDGLGVVLLEPGLVLKRVDYSKQ